jgi:hypothetical protein
MNASTSDEFNRRDVDAADVEIRRTYSWRPFVRTSNECFDDLPDYPWSPNYAEVDGMRMHYVETDNPAVRWCCPPAPCDRCQYRVHEQTTAGSGSRRRRVPGHRA